MPQAPASELPSPIAHLLALPDGERKVGPFVLLRQLGRGGFAPVWLAREEYAGVELRSVAVKLFALRPGGGSMSGRDSRIIIEEARALCRVEHPNVVRFCSLALDEPRGVLGLAMEYLSGQPLDRALEEHGRLSVTETIDVALAVASALAALHSSGVVHRDVKPANIVKTTTGYKLIDFGLASHALTEPDIAQRGADDVQTSSATLRSALVRATRQLGERPDVLTLCGTMGYIDPECISRSVPANPASDLYALGATLFELLVGQLPAEVDGVRDEIIDGRTRPASARSLRADVPLALGELVDGLLQPRSDQRPPSTEWVAARLRSIRDSITPPAQHSNGRIVASPPRSGLPLTAPNFPKPDATFVRLPDSTGAALATVAAPSLARLAPLRQYGFPDPPLPNGRQALPRK